MTRAPGLMTRAAGFIAGTIRLATATGRWTVNVNIGTVQGVLLDAETNFLVLVPTVRMIVAVILKAVRHLILFCIRSLVTVVGVF